MATNQIMSQSPTSAHSTHPDLRGNDRRKPPLVVDFERASGGYFFLRGFQCKIAFCSHQYLVATFIGGKVEIMETSLAQQRQPSLPWFFPIKEPRLR